MSIDTGRKAHTKTSSVRYHPYDQLKSGITSGKGKTAAVNRLSLKSHHKIMSACKKVNDAAILYPVAKIKTAVCTPRDDSNLLECSKIAITLEKKKRPLKEEGTDELAFETCTQPDSCLLVRGNGDGTGSLAIFRVSSTSSVVDDGSTVVIHQIPSSVPLLSLEKLKGGMIFWIKNQLPIALEKRLLEHQEKVGKKPNKDHAISAADYEALIRRIQALE